uniref:Cyanobacterial aminoacyl-tRNA synthetase CAAD domain-containing protein n=1 Tax=Cyanothece sp. (strain PCC 7425 / ATCC 29141) TaxID=395961 RepID=B8HWG6_CYAP4
MPDLREEQQPEGNPVEYPPEATTTPSEPRDIGTDPQSTLAEFTEPSSLADAPVEVNPADFYPVEGSIDTLAEQEPTVTADLPSPTPTVVSEPTAIAPASRPQISSTLQNIDLNLDQFQDWINTYSGPAARILVILVSVLLTLILISSLLNAINFIPLLSASLKLIGLGYTIWFVRRYLLFAANRQELAARYQAWRQRIAGNLDSDTPVGHS